jgi:NAD(P)-dependent dehydrogenase (short-subunit alcohol dehydrogenase family)
MSILAGKRIIVTGAGRGLGRAYALAIAAAGGRVVVNDIDDKEAVAVCEEIQSAGAQAIPSSHSVSDAAGAAAMVELCISKFGGLDGLVNNAGLFHMASAVEEDLVRARRLIEVNVLGAMNCGLAAIRHLSAQGHGTVINVASGAALGIAGMSTYAASKGAIISLTRAWALDLAGSGVNVVAVSPVAQTRMTPQSARTVSGAPQDASQPEAIAPLVVYLLAGGAAALHGAIVRLANGELSLLEPARFGAALGRKSTWDVTSLAEALGPVATAAAGSRPAS